MPQKAFFLRSRNLLLSQKTMQRHFFSPTLHPLSPVIFATATALAFVLPRDSRFNFHCYTQHEATPTLKSARKCAATSCDFLRERLQSAFTLANQLRWIAQQLSVLFNLSCVRIFFMMRKWHILEASVTNSLRLCSGTRSDAWTYIYTGPWSDESVTDTVPCTRVAQL